MIFWQSIRHYMHVTDEYFVSIFCESKAPVAIPTILLKYLGIRTIRFFFSRTAQPRTLLLWGNRGIAELHFQRKERCKHTYSDILWCMSAVFVACSYLNFPCMVTQVSLTSSTSLTCRSISHLQAQSVQPTIASNPQNFLILVKIQPFQEDQIVRVNFGGNVHKMTPKTSRIFPFDGMLHSSKLWSFLLKDFPQSKHHISSMEIWNKLMQKMYDAVRQCGIWWVFLPSIYLKVNSRENWPLGC